MNKTILKLDKELSIAVLSGICMIFIFLSDYSQIDSFISFLLVSVKAIIFILVPFIVFLLEKENDELKKVAGIYTSYFIINFIVIILLSVSIVNNIIPIFWKWLFDFVNLFVLLSCLFIFIEQMMIYSNIKNKVYTNSIMKIVYLVGNFVSYPFLKFINSKSKEKGE